MIGLYYVLPVLGAPPVLQVALYAGISGSAAIGVGFGVRHYRPAYRSVWWWLMAGQLASAIADVTFFGST